MANDNLYPGQSSGQPLGTGEGESPLAKPVVPNMDVRTMSSDAQSINTSSPIPRPYAPQASAPENIPVAPATPAATTPEQSFRIPETDTATKEVPPEIPSGGKGKKGLFTAIIAFIVIIALAALGYFVIYPIFFSEPVPEVSAPAATTPEPTLPTGVTPTPEPTPAPEPAAIPNPPTHVSLFSTSANFKIDSGTVTTGANLSSVVGFPETASGPAVVEIIYKNADGSLVKFTDVLKAATGLDISSNQSLATAFNDDTATGVVYVGAANTRFLGFAAQLASGADAAVVGAAFKQAFESVSDYGPLFSSAPGTAKTWKDGQISGVTGNRYLLFGNPGFAVDYGWIGTKLLIMTSYDGFKEAAGRLQ
jgi:hypothetical protein